jgi:cytochrome c553
MSKTIATGVSSALILLALNVYAQGNPEAGKQQSTTCQGCHGADGRGVQPIYPRLAGQYPDYLAKALHDYKRGSRENPIMKGMAAGLSDQQIADLAAYYGGL